ncbi:hypothetical protein GWC77_12065 [Paraburkholderia sp. NMBU_R16]|uniref:hypothetical protein n=1 Tax=Paraburkholderia sp. NMBU_R16 TaxID=2698676 RepID=UPI001567B98E|nr:hypothetical protein [Paraburkholderia sp. NMBU_R16]NRO96658.1 hypothetical protein [Paraburkholderia sp. NMBU_R16]
MEMDEFRPYRGYFYRVSASFGQDGQWRGTIDILRRHWDGAAETVISKMDVPGKFLSEELALAASDAYCHVIIDEAKFQG